MEKNSYKQNAYYLIYLIRCVLNNKNPEKEKLDKMDLSGVFAVAKAHSLTAIAAYALESEGIHNKDFEDEKNRAIRKTIILDSERERVFSEFEKAGIWYMPLKGIILKEYYPAIGMRQMADNDFLIDMTRQKDVKDIMLSCGFRVEQYDKSKHDVYFKEPVCNFQMHVSLFEEDPKERLYCYFKDIDKRLAPDKGSKYGQHFTNEDYYLYIKAHEYKHYSSSGTGLRNLVDTYVFIDRFGDTLDWEYLHSELNKLGLLDYEKKSRNLSKRLFCGVKLNNDEKMFLDYYIFSGTYGTTKNSVNNKIQKLGGDRSAKWKYVLDRFSVPFSKNNPQYRAYKAQYPFFYEHKILLPTLPFYRLFRSLYISRKRILTEIKILLKI